MKWLTQQLKKFIVRFQNYVYLDKVDNPGTDTDKFLVIKDGKVGYRTGTEVLSDIGGSTSSGTVTSVSVSDGSTSTAITSSGTFTFSAGEGVDVGESSGTITYSGEDASTSNKGIARFDSDDFAVSSGAVSLVDLTTSHIAAGTLVIESEGIAGNEDDAKLATTAAVKDYVDTQDNKPIYCLRFMGYTIGNGSTFEYGQSLTDGQAPWEHAAAHNADVTTVMDVSDYFRAGGQVVTQNATIKRIVGWAACNGTPTCNLILARIRPAEDDNSDVAPVIVHDIQWTALASHDKLKALNVTSITAGDVAAGDILVTFVKTGSGNVLYFNINVELQVG